MKRRDGALEPMQQSLLYQLLETELGGVMVYEAALTCAVNEQLKEEWTEYLAQTRRHVEIARDLLTKLGLDPEAEVPGRKVLQLKAEALVKAMQLAVGEGEPAAAELVACECVVDAETKDHLNWHLLELVAQKAPKELAEPMKAALDEVEDEEDQHLYHTKGWARELWLQAMGIPAVIPPPEEVKAVTTAIGAARAEQARSSMRPHH